MDKFLFVHGGFRRVGCAYLFVYISHPQWAPPPSESANWMPFSHPSYFPTFRTFLTFLSKPSTVNPNPYLLWTVDCGLFHSFTHLLIYRAPYPRNGSYEPGTYIFTRFTNRIKMKIISGSALTLLRYVSKLPRQGDGKKP
jgi:hypothetical protein